MSDPDYLAPYRPGAKRHPDKFAVTLWASEQGQIRRFEVIAESIFLPGKRILDAGCSRGDFAQFLIDRGIAYQRFIGVDALEPVIQQARKRNFPDARFETADFVRDPQSLAIEKPHVVTISGSLNTMQDHDAMTVLNHAWNAASQSLAFNFLSDRAAPDAPKQDRFARRLSTMMLLDWAFEKTPYVIFRQDYFKQGHDATIIMHRRTD